MGNIVTQPSVDRSCVLAIIRDVHEAVMADRAAGVSRNLDTQTGELVERACAKQGVSVDAWTAALHADPELLRLFETALDEVVVGSTDPGPYDAISRESPRGTPDPLPEGFERDARLLGGREDK